MKFRVSNETNWATEFTAETEEEFAVEFPAALRRAQTLGHLLVGLQFFSADFRCWCAVNGRALGVFYAQPGALRRCRPGRWEIRGHGLEFLSVSPDEPCADVVWDLAHHRPLRRSLPTEECRANQCLTAEDLAAGRSITHAHMQEAFDAVLGRVQGSATIWPAVREAVANYRALSERFVAQGGTRGTLVGAMANLMDRVAARAGMAIGEILLKIGT